MKKLLLFLFTLLFISFIGCTLPNQSEKPIKLDTPVVTLTDDLATWSEDLNANKFEISVNGTISYVENSVTSKKLNSGDELKVRAIGDGKKYSNSDFSNTVTYTPLPHEHEFGEVEYVWSEDNLEVKATRTCIHDQSHIETETVNTTYVVTQEQSCTNDELTKYEASFTNSAFSTQTKENVKTKEKLGHNFTWIIDKEATEETTGYKHEKCTVCSEKRNENTIIEKLEHVHNLEHVNKIEATCLDDGTLDHYHCTKCNKNYSDINALNLLDSITINKLGHSYGEVEYVWSEDNLEVKATRVCTHDQSHIETETVNTTYAVTQEQSCTNDELTKYEASFINIAFSKQIKENVKTKEKLGHSYTWIIDKEATEETTGYKHEKCTVCSEKRNENTVIEKLGHNLVHVNKIEPTCLDDGTIEHYHCTNCDRNYNDINALNLLDSITINKLGHSYGDVEYVWSKDNLEVTAMRTCIHDKSHIESETVYTNVEIIQNPNELGIGINKYTTNKFNNDLYQIQTKESEINYEDYFVFTLINDTYTLAKFKNNLSTVVIPSEYKGKKVTSIGNQAFENCSRLISITIPEGVTSIGDSAFSYCLSLTNIIIPEGLTSIGRTSFEYCISLTSITLPKSLKSIGWFTFRYCYRLVEIYNLSNLDIKVGTYDYGYIGSYAKVIHKDINEPSRIITIDGYQFIKDDNDIYYLFNYIGSDTILTLPDSINNGNYQINDYAFYRNTSLTSVIIPNNVTSIGVQAFYHCTNLTSVKLPENLIAIGDYAFSNCVSLTNITVPKGVTKIGINAFYNCNKLVEIYNLSNLDIKIGSEDYGYIGYYAKVIHKDIN